MMNEYNQQQFEAITMVQRYLGGLSEPEIKMIRRLIHPYLRFRSKVADFQGKHFSEICTVRCFTSQKSACCGREGIATFFADVLINVFLSTEKEVETILNALSLDRGGFKCVYLTESGCRWRIKPIVCEMFLCDNAKVSVLEGDDLLRTRWEELRQKEREFTWPDKPVVFDELEELFLRAGFESPLMYFHRSPGLIQVKRTYQLQK